MKHLLLVLTLIPLLPLAACGEGDETPSSSDPAALLGSFWLETAPEDASEVLTVRQEARSGDEVALVGRIRDYNPAQALFTLADRSLVPCNERRGNSCQTPWDYCSEEAAALATGTVVVELRKDGSPLPVGLAGFHGFDHLATLFVSGKVLRDASGNVIIVASGIHVSP